MADPQRPDPNRPPHPGQHPNSLSTGRNTTGRWIGIVVGVLVLAALLWWMLGGTTQTPGQEHTLGEPAGVGTAADPAAGDAVDPAADPDDPQAAIGADPFTEPTSPAAADQADAPGAEADGEAAPAN